MGDRQRFLVMTESASRNAPPEETISYVENVHHYLGGLFRIVVREMQNYRVVLVGVRLKPKKPTK